MSVKNISSAAASIIKLFIILFLFNSNTKAQDNNIKYYSDDMGTLTLMYHRFNEPKYPSTNIQMDIFKEQIKIINKLNYKFYDPSEFEKNFNLTKKEKRILITIDDGFSSFYNNAWPFLKKNKIPFILFVSTDAVGKSGYMTWDQIKEIEKEKFVYIGNHSHSHDYLVEFTENEFLDDINNAIITFKNKLGYNPIFFSYPFGEYSEYMKAGIKKKFKLSFGQHSGVIDVNKDLFELPRFPINEKYGDLKRFEFLINLNSFQFKKLTPNEKYLSDINNPPSFFVEFFENQNNIQNTNCFSNEGNNWRKSEVFIKNNILEIKFEEKFLPRRGRINCSLNDNGVWRWFGVQYSIKKN
jgi:peptidoglycan/xylan/chitin deacetylase (PgdA/CDA1 family)